MTKEKLNEAYRKLYGMIETYMSDELYASTRSQINKFEMNLEDELSYFFRQAGIQNSFSIRRNIESIIEESHYQIKREIAQCRDLLQEASRNFYSGVANVLTTNLEPPQKKAKVEILFENYKTQLRSLHRRSQNVEFELFSALNTYFIRNFGDNENLYDDIKSYLRNYERRFVDTYSENLVNVLNVSTKRVGEDLQEYVIPLLISDKEKSEKDELLEQMKNDPNYKFKFKNMPLAAIIKAATQKEVDITNLNLELYEIYNKTMDFYRRITDKCVTTIVEKLNNGSPDAPVVVNNILEKINIEISTNKTKDFTNGAYKNFMQEFIGEHGYGPKDQKILMSLVPGMESEYNAFLKNSINEILKETLLIISKYIKAAQYDRAVSEINNGTIVPDGEQPPSGPKF